MPNPNNETDSQPSVTYHHADVKMSHARIEEVSDSDPEEGNISDFDDDFDEREILKQKAPLGPKPSEVRPPTSANKSSLINPSAVPSSSRGRDTVTGPDGQKYTTAEDNSIYNDYQCLYPIYFDANRSRAEGRRVGKELAVENPLAREIVSACAALRLETLFEPTKIHPKDWANPGRVKIKLKGGRNPTIKNKHHLYVLVSKHLQANPSTVETATKVRVPGMPIPEADKPYPEPAAPKGWKMNKLLPYYSPGLSGGGVSENFLKDMMAEMQANGHGMPGGGAGGGMPDMSALQTMMGMGMGGGAGPSTNANAGPKKDKKKKVKG